MSESDLFTPTTTPAEPTAPSAPAEVDYLAELVGEDKKFKSAGDLARGKAEADMFVDRLKAEMQGLRDELKTRTSLEEFMDKMNSNTKETPPQNGQPINQDTPPAEPAGDSKGLSPEQIEALLEQKLSQREQEINQTRNVEEVKAKLLKHYGEDFQIKLKERAAELGLGEKFLDDLAKSQPKAFSHLLGLEDAPLTPASSSNVFGDSSVISNQSNTSATMGGASSGQMKFSDFEKIRKSDPSEYWTPAVQNKMHKLAQALGREFYN